MKRPSFDRWLIATGYTLIGVVGVCLVALIVLLLGWYSIPFIGGFIVVGGIGWVVALIGANRES